MYGSPNIVDNLEPIEEKIGDSSLATYANPLKIEKINYTENYLKPALIVT